MLRTIIIAIIIIQIADNVVTWLYSLIAKRFYTSVKASQENNSSAKGDIQQYSSSLLKTAYGFYGGWVRYKLIRLGRVPCHCYRILKLKYIYNMSIAKKVVIYGGFEIRCPWNITIGEGSVIGDEAKLDGRNGITIGKNVQFSTGVWVWSEQHDIDDPFFATNDKGGRVIIDDRAWISTRVVILPRTHIMEGSVVAAGAVVTKDCEAFSINGGIPAKKIGERNKELKYCFSGTHLPFY